MELLVGRLVGGVLAGAGIVIFPFHGPPSAVVVVTRHDRGCQGHFNWWGSWFYLATPLFLRPFIADRNTNSKADVQDGNSSRHDSSQNVSLFLIVGTLNVTAYYNAQAVTFSQRDLHGTFGHDRQRDQVLGKLYHSPSFYVWLQSNYSFHIATLLLFWSSFRVPSVPTFNRNFHSRHFIAFPTHHCCCAPWTIYGTEHGRQVNTM